ncbi:restriction endonuclease subunit S [Bifidobacterium adolescentis]|uniref:restriction endonuclease subunit S n=1 Tax=Bifidobacterium adolescentis TaxID=1680 RepID=UPI0018976391|nr:restriction endonuclease subunit S [Bifidobacterium adolescentis]
MKSSKPQFVGKKVRLGDIVKIEKASMPSGNNVWVLNLDAVEKGTGKVIVKNRMKADSAGTSTVAFTADAVLYSKLRPNLNKVVVADEPGLATSEMLPLIVNPEVLDRRYFAYLLRSNSFVNLAVSSTAGSKMPRMNKKTLLNAVFPIPSLELQHQRIDLLSSIEKARTKAELLIQQLDTLVKSRFIEMFGDPVEENRWARITLASLCTKLGSGATPRGGKAAYKTSGIPLIRSMNVHNGYFESKDLAYIDEIQAKKLDNVTLHKGDVLLNITGASVARSCLLPDYLAGGRVNQHVSIVRCDPNRMLPRVLNSIFTSDSYQRFLLEHSRMAGATREAITKDDLETMTVPLPPLSLQYKFAAFVAQVDKSRFGGMLHLLNSLSGIMHASFFSVADTD